jgi:hypothetical protein
MRSNVPWKLVIFALVVTIGIAAPYTISDGVDRFSDRTERLVAIEAITIAEIVCLGNPIARLIIPRTRVTDVRVVPGSCETMKGAPGLRGSDWQATLKAHGPFGIPLRTLTATCGGTAVACG